MDIEMKCTNCGGVEKVINIDEADWERYMKGEHVQDVWPDLGTNNCEILIGARTGTHFCPTCWDIIFTEEEN
jgi:hypothetical protein